MVELKNQHYVPKHYLRAWADSGELNVLPLAAGKIYPENTDSVCSRNYFYGNPPVVEEELVSLDGYHAHPIRELRHGAELTDISNQRIKLLLSFITTQRTRSKATKEDIKQGYDYLKEAVEDDMEEDRYNDRIKWDPNLNDEEKKEKMIDTHLRGIHHYLISLGIFGYFGILDLEGVMLCNRTSREFIISDTPMVLDIPQYKERLGLVPAGIGNRGLQIFCPINQNRILLLYDRTVYRFNSNSKKQILVKSPNVVDQLNLLQFHNAESIVMFNDSSEDYILNLYDRIDEVRRREEITTTPKTETGGEFEIEDAPAYQVPKFSPDLPNYKTMSGVEFVQRRPTSQVERGRQLVRSIFDEVNWASDLAITYCIRVFEEKLGM